MREESSLSHQRPGLGRGSPQSTPRRARRLTANVKRRNLLRSTGLSRAAPDLMDSQICREEKQRQGRSRGSPPASLPGAHGAAGQCAFLPTGPAHSSWAPCRDRGKSRSILSLAGSQYQGGNPARSCLGYCLPQMFTYCQLQSKHIGATEVKRHSPLPPEAKSLGESRAPMSVCRRQQGISQTGGQYLGEALTLAKDRRQEGARDGLQRP